MGNQEQIFENFANIQDQQHILQQPAPQDQDKDKNHLGLILSIGGAFILIISSIFVYFKYFKKSEEIKPQ